jgi:uncharacterized membrane protein YozB (DUF420 family)
MTVFAQIFFIVGIVWGFLAIVLMIAAWLSIRRGNEGAHRRFMLVLLAGGWAFVAFYLIGYALEQTYSDIVPERLVPWLAIHGVMALATLFFLSVLVWARLSAQNGAGEQTLALPNFLNRHHRNFGRITAVLWLLTQLGGFINLYILR